MKKVSFCLLFLIIAACSPAPAAGLPYDISATPHSLLRPATPTPPLPTPTAMPTGPAFPRLGMWWPNPYEQSLEEIARYDWVILGDWSSEFISPLLDLNPEMRLLNSTNACELDFDPTDAEYNRYLQAIPYQWYLTQVGSRLREAIDASQTGIPVEALTAGNANGEFDLFVAGDTALIEGESIYIKAVDQARRLLIVERGYVRPAAAHPAGTRIAAHISFWPHSWLLNVSRLAPLAVADPAIGAERWTDYNARRAAALLVDPRWAGILVDRSDPDESWLIGNSTARTIDPDQSNRLLNDYAAFDQSWNAGLRAYLDALRAAIGPERIIFLNWGIAHYAPLNGNNFEGFPGESGRPWHAQVFGPLASGSYFEWMAQARQPNLTMIETYEDDGGPAATSDGDYDNPCAQPDFAPNYRKMRFGLATALLNDGYFSYEMNTNGHGSLCLLWFDEYDNAGAGRGYLGYPLGAAERIAPGLDETGLLLQNGLDSEADLAAWEPWFEDGYELAAGLDEEAPAAGAASVRLEVTRALGEDWRASFSVAPLEVNKGEDYTLSFYARSAQPRTISAWVQQDREPWQTWLWYGELPLTPDWRRFEIPLASEGDDSQARLLFGLGKDTGVVWLDEVQFQRGGTDVWRRDYQHGIVLVNAGAQSVQLDLGGSFVKIDGRQDRSLNDGTTVDRVTLPPRDGIILLRIK